MAARLVDLHTHVPKDHRLASADLVFQRIENPESYVVHRSTRGDSGVLLSRDEFYQQYAHAPNAVRVDLNDNNVVEVHDVRRYVT